MKKIFQILALLLITLASFGQYNPSQHTVSNSAYGMAQFGPSDARSYFYDATVFKYRPYVSLTEVRNYLNLAKYRGGQFDIVVNTGGTLSNGVITGGSNAVWYFKDGTLDGDLVLKGAVSSVNGQTGVVVTKNADSLHNLRIDTGVTAIRNGYILAFDSTNRKWYMIAPATGTTYTQGTGIIIASGIISADNTTAIWNASQLRGRGISAGTPAAGNIMKWSGTSWDYATDLSGIDTGYVSGDTMNLIINVGSGNPDTIFINNVATKTYVDSMIANIPLNPTVTTDGVTITGDGSPGNPLVGDTLNTLATQFQILLVNERIDSLNLTPTGLDTVAHDLTLTGKGTLADKLKVDTVVMATQSWVNENFVAPTIPTVSPGTGITVGTAPNYVISATGTPTSNPFKALTIESYGGVANAVVPASGANATGTNNTPAFNSMATAAADGQWIVVPSGEWLFSTAPDSLYLKRFYILIIGNTYHNQQNFLVIKNNSGAFKQHRIIHCGLAWGRVNLPSHTSGISGTRVSPNWSAYTGTCFTVYNTDQVKIWFNKLSGWAKGVEVAGSGGNGSQENEFYGGWISESAVCISVRSIDGSSFTDKNKFFVARLGGGLGIKIDGYSGVASNGETWNGAARSNEFHVLFEFIDSAIFAWGDITEPWFDVTVEGGTWTGILGASPFNCKLNNNTGGANSATNFVRTPRYTGQGYYDTKRLGSGSLGTLGIDGTIKCAIWNINSYLGNEAIIDGSGNVNVFTKVSTSQAVRAAAQTYIKFVNYLAPEVQQVVTSSYAPAATDRVIYCNGSAITITMPTASSYPTRRLTFVNINAVSGVIFSPIGVSNGIVSGFAYYLPPKKTITYRSDGANWYTESEVGDAYERKFGIGAEITITATSVAPVFNSPVGNDDREDIPVGSSYRCNIHGEMTITATTTDPTITFAIGNFNQTVQLDIPTLTSRPFEIEMVITKRTSSVHWQCKIVIDNGSLNIIKIYEGNGAAFNTTGVDLTADWQWLTAGNSITFKDGYWEIFRLVQ